MKSKNYIGSDFTKFLEEENIKISKRIVLIKVLKIRLKNRKQKAF